MRLFRLSTSIVLGLVTLVILLPPAFCDEDVEVEDETENVVLEVPENEIVYETPTPVGNYYIAESFDDIESFKKRWIKSSAKKDDADESIAKYDGVWEIEPALESPLKNDYGLILKSKAKHHAISAKLSKTFHFTDRPFIVQYEVNFQNGQECGGAYLKLLSEDKHLDLKNFHDKTPYSIMFGPDKCGADSKLHFIFKHKNPRNGTLSEKHAKRPSGKFEEFYKDKKPHLYTLVVHPDNTFEVLVDHVVINSGNLLEDFSPPVNPPAEIDDPNDHKPDDWDEKEKIPDPDAVKPDDWDEDAPHHITDPNAVKPSDWLDEEPEMIPDPNAEKPSDWDEEMDGDWEPPLINNPKCENTGCGKWKPPTIVNPAYKGKWYPPLINNPNYKGKWRPGKIANPDYFEDKNPFKMTSIAAVGIEIWSMSDAIYFDNIIITDDKDTAFQWAQQSFELKRKKSEIESGGLITRVLSYTNNHPWLWAVYIVVIGLPVALIVVFCCSSSEDKEEQKRAAAAKKKDTYTPDDLVPSSSSAAEPETVQEEEVIQEEEEEETNDVEDEKEINEVDEEEEEVVEEESKSESLQEEAAEQNTESTGRSPRKRKTRKE